MKKAMTTVLAICAAIGWWGALYPQFTLLDDTYRIVSEEEVANTDTDVLESELDKSRLYWSILDADCDRIRFKSRLFADWRELHESGDQ